MSSSVTIASFGRKTRTNSKDERRRAFVRQQAQLAWTIARQEHAQQIEAKPLVGEVIELVIDSYVGARKTSDMNKTHVAVQTMRTRLHEEDRASTRQIDLGVELATDCLHQAWEQLNTQQAK